MVWLRDGVGLRSGWNVPSSGFEEYCSAVYEEQMCRDAPDCIVRSCNAVSDQGFPIYMGQDVVQSFEMPRDILTGLQVYLSSDGVEGDPISLEALIVTADSMETVIARVELSLDLAGKGGWISLPLMDLEMHAGSMYRLKIRRVKNERASVYWHVSDLEYKNIMNLDACRDIQMFISMPSGQLAYQLFAKNHGIDPLWSSEGRRSQVPLLMNCMGFFPNASLNWK